MELNLDDRNQVLDYLALSLGSEIDYFDNDKELELYFIEYSIKNAPFGILADFAGIGYNSIEKHKIKAIEVWEKIKSLS